MKKGIVILLVGMLISSYSIAQSSHEAKQPKAKISEYHRYKYAFLFTTLPQRVVRPAKNPQIKQHHGHADSQKKVLVYNQHNSLRGPKAKNYNLAVSYKQNLEALVK